MSQQSGTISTLGSKRKPAGVALIATLLFLTVLAIMVISLIVMARGSVFLGLSQHQKSQALYLAEAGLAYAQSALEDNVNWTGIESGTIEGLPGTYTVSFGEGRSDSVNNIGQMAPAPSYRGPDTVPANCALLIVSASVSGQTYVLEALVEGNGSVGSLGDAILTSGRIVTRGDLKVDGVAGLEDAEPVAGSIQSNQEGTDDLVVWEGAGVAHISGDVGSRGSAASAVDMTGATIEGATELNTSATIPHYDVASEVSSHSASPEPGFASLGTTTLTGGEYHTSGDQVVNGDIVLEEGAALYIEGDLTVNGSISGAGEIWVTGDTTFKGDSRVVAKEDHHVSVFSQGNVELTGFDGTAYLEALASSNPTAQEHYNISREAIQSVQIQVQSSGSLAGSQDAVWDMGIVLGEHRHGDGTGALKELVVQSAPRSRTLFKLRDEVADLPQGQTRDFMMERLEDLGEMFSCGTYQGTHFQHDRINDFENNGATVGILDSIVTENRQDLWPAASNMINQVSYDHMGSSHFVGAIYTKGYFYADNEVSVMGALIVDGDGSGGEDVMTGSGPVHLKSGDLFLGHRSRVTFVEEFFSDEETDLSGAQLLARKLWMGR